MGKIVFCFSIYISMYMYHAQYAHESKWYYHLFNKGNGDFENLRTFSLKLKFDSINQTTSRHKQSICFTTQLRFAFSKLESISICWIIKCLCNQKSIKSQDQNKHLKENYNTICPQIISWQKRYLTTIFNSFTVSQTNVSTIFIFRWDMIEKCSICNHC